MSYSCSYVLVFFCSLQYFIEHFNYPLGGGFVGKNCSDNRLDLTLYDLKSWLIDSDSLTLRNVREIGAEWICYNTWHPLGINEVLVANGFNEMKIQLAQFTSY